jgi:hypothetical protein
MPYDPAVIRAIQRIGRKRNEPKKYVLGELATGIVESGLQNLPGGDADSYGFRQQRASIYGRQPLRKQINNLYDEFHQYDKGQPLGSLIADVQRPAAQYRGRYAQVLDRARALLGHNGSDAGGVPITAAGANATPSAQPGVNIFSTLAGLNAPMAQQNPAYEQLQRGWELLSQLQEQRSGANSPVSSLGSIGGSYTPASGGGSPKLSNIVSEANKIDRAHVPYLWGGGHQGRQSGKVQPVDCSGAVSRVLGIDPRVSGEFEQWGQGGRGKNVTIYANKTHVLMEINGHFWGTSASNPGGGAGWIPREKITPSYLKNFTARHPRGL